MCAQGDMERTAGARARLLPERDIGEIHPQCRHHIPVICS